MVILQDSLGNTKTAGSRRTVCTEALDPRTALGSEARKLKLDIILLDCYSNSAVVKDIFEKDWVEIAPPPQAQGAMENVQEQAMDFFDEDEADVGRGDEPQLSRKEAEIKAFIREIQEYKAVLKGLFLTAMAKDGSNKATALFDIHMEQDPFKFWGTHSILLPRL
jgi:hypothetical protein